MLSTTPAIFLQKICKIKCCFENLILCFKIRVRGSGLWLLVTVSIRVQERRHILNFTDGFSVMPLIQFGLPGQGESSRNFFRLWLNL